jgi:hypothetical protein
MSPEDTNGSSDMTEPAEPTEPTEPTEPKEPAGQSGPTEEELRPAMDLTLRAAVLELERHAAAAGWDQAAQLYALVAAGDVLSDDPQAADLIGLAPDTDPDVLVTIEQGDLPAEVSLEQLLEQIEWPTEVRGTAVVLERVVLPPSVGDVPEDVAEATRFAQEHPEREEVRIVAGALRGGATYAAMRLKSRDDDFAVLESPDLVPTLLQLLQTTLAPATPETG